jgi:CRISPR-associated endonuclease Csn1
LETVNNIRLTERGKGERELTEDERDAVIARLRCQKTGSVAAVREALKIDKRTLKKSKKGDNSPDFYRLNIEADEDKEINTDWFHREVVLGVFGEERWNGLGEEQRESVNRTLLRLDVESPEVAKKLEVCAERWWGLSVTADREKLLAVWRKMPPVDARLKLSRQAILNVLPLMEQANANPKPGKSRWRTVTEARQEFAEDGRNSATPEQRVRYAHWISPELRQVLLGKAGGDEEEVKRLLSLRGLNAADRHYLRKHPGLLPPAPDMPNPVVRKAIHEVRRHIAAYLRKYGRKPDRIVIELARETTQPKKLRDQQLKLNRKRDQIRKDIIKEFNLSGRSKSEREKAIARVILCKQQKLASAYTGQPITLRNAVHGKNDSGDGLEIDHVIPRASGGGDGWNNLVLCYAKENRTKSKQSPIQWLQGESFQRFEAIFRHLEKGQDSTGGYFTTKECVRKWENLHRAARPEDEWRPSQLTDTSYAAKAVAQYLQSALFSDDPVEESGEPKRRVFFTKGRYTAKLRNDWKLFEKLREPRGEDGEATTVDLQNAAEEAKNRGDHRHHAIDAVAIALCDSAILTELGRRTREYDEQRLAAKECSRDPDAVVKPKPISPPSAWPTVGEFRKAVLSKMYEEFDASDEAGRKVGRRERIGVNKEQALPWGVSHRPVKRKIVGGFHQGTLYGPVLDDGERFTVRVNVGELKPGYLKLSPQQRDALKAGMRPSPEDDPAIDRNSYLVRDLGLRLAVRELFVKAGMDPDKFTPNQLKALIDQGKFRLPSGVPVKSVVCLKTIKKPVRYKSKSVGVNVDGRADRVYIAGNNHHIEYRLDPDLSGQWTGQVVRTDEIAERLRNGLKAATAVAKEVKARCLPLEEEKREIADAIRRVQSENPLVDRRTDERGAFVMSLAEGETVWMKHPETKFPGYFVVFEIPPTKRVGFIHHTDARKEMGIKDDANNVIVGSKRDGFNVSPSDLQTLGVEPFKHPVKVRIDPLGQAHVLEQD